MHTWSDVAYGFFVGTGNVIPPFLGLIAMALTGFVCWMVYKE